MQNVGNELKRYFKNNGIPQRVVAEKVNLSAVGVSQLLNGKKNFTRKSATIWNKAYGFKVAWLLSGDGPMFEDETKNPIHQSISNNSGVAIQQAGNGSNASAPSTNNDKSEGFFTRLCTELMQQIMERDEKICCLEKQIKDLQNGNL